MFRRVVARLTYANVVATLSLFLVLSGGTAVALSGTNTVFSDDIVDGQVRSADVLDDGLTATDLRAGSVTGSEIANDSIIGLDVRADSLTGADVLESSLGEVPRAANGVRAIHYLGPRGPDETVYSEAGVQLRLLCGGPPGSTELRLDAVSANGGSANWSFTAVPDSRLSTTTGATLHDGQGYPVVEYGVTDGSDDAGQLEGQLVVRTDGAQPRVVSFVLHALVYENGCEVTGTAAGAGG